MNAPADASGQSPAHLAACGGEAFFLLWQLQTGANLNQQVKTTYILFLPLLIWKAEVNPLTIIDTLLREGFLILSCIA